MILDNTPVINLSFVPGKFIDVPTIKLLGDLKSKKERISLFLRFLEKCRDVFGLTAKIKNVYLPSGEPILELKEIPDQEKYIYISLNDFFIGVNIVNYSIKLKDYRPNKEKSNENDVDTYKAVSLGLERSKAFDSQVNNQEENEYKNLCSLDHKSSMKNFYKNLAKENQEKISFYKTKRKLDVYKKIRKLNSIANHNIVFLDKIRNHSFDIGEYQRKEQKKLNTDCVFFQQNYYKAKFSCKLCEGEKETNTRNSYFNLDFITKPVNRSKESENEALAMKTSSIAFSCKYQRSHHYVEKLNDNDYLSETDTKKTNAWNFITINFQDGFKLYLYYYDYLASQNWIFLKNKIKEKMSRTAKNRYISRKLNTNLVGLVDDFNKDIRKKIYALNIYMEKRKKLEKKKQEANNKSKNDCPDEQTRKFKETMQNKMIKMMKKFLENLNLFKKKDADYNEYFLNQEYNKKSKLPYVQKNKEQFRNVYFFMDSYVNSVLPTLFNFNIPFLLEKYKNFTREELYELYTQYKILMKICIASNKNPLLVKKGIDFNSFHKGVLQMSNESDVLARKIFQSINESGTGFLSLDEFLKGMSIIKSENIADKINMFFRIIDTDGNGRLSWDEVFEISIMSLRRSIVNKDEKSEKLIDNLAKYFADLIFNLVDVDKADEIPLPKIREVNFGNRISLIFFN